MGNKYYAPSIEEFYIGFEFQKWNVHNYYYETLIMKDSTLEFIKDRLNEIRVKYLDKEDIESFGFRCTGDCGIEKEFQIDYKYGWIVLEMSFDNKITVDYEWENDTIGHTSTNTMFTGIIKNKSELKKLLKQLNIL